MAQQKFITIYDELKQGIFDGTYSYGDQLLQSMN